MFKSKESASSPEQTINEQKRKFFYQFARQYPDVIKLYREQGLLPKNEGWSNVAHHCLVEGVAADTLAEKIALSEEDKQVLTECALLHDFYKRKSIELIRANPDNAVKADILSGEQSTAILIEKGVNEKVIVALKNALGPDSLKSENVEKMTTVEKIMHYLDDITLGDDLVPLKERMAALKIRYPIINEEGNGIFGKPYYDQQYEIGAGIEAELAERLVLERPEDLPKYLRDKIFERISKVTFGQ
jgi:hypothetical protein